MKKMPSTYARTDFGPPPPGYIPGLGRGAIGFITRSDIGEAIQNKDSAPEPEENINDANFDNWNGYGNSLFANGSYEEDDKDADKVYNQIDDRMDERRKERREKKLKQELDKIQKEKPTIAQTFSDLKRDLGTVSLQEWQALPEAVDGSIKKVKKEKYIPIPDSVIESARKDSQLSGTISVAPGGTTSEFTNLNEVGSARGTILASKLDKQSESVSGTKTVDKKGLLTELASVPVHTEAEIQDFERVRKIMKSVINSNPKNPDGWIAAARIEELDGKVANARNILHQGLKFCEFSDDLWIETARLEPPKTSRALLAHAISLLPKSFKIWQTAVYNEKDPEVKKKILKRSLEHIPNNPRLWKDLIELEKDDQEAKELLYKAVECVPGNIDMWLALAKLETYQNAKKVINRAREALPTEHTLYIAAAKLEEAEGKSQQHIETLVSKGIQRLKKNGYIVNRDQWLEEAEYCERSGNPIVCVAATKAVAFEGLLQQTKCNNIVDNMKDLAQKKSLTTLRALYEISIEKLPMEEKKVILNLALDIEIDNLKEGEEEHMDKVIDRAIQLFPEDEHFWIKCTKDLWKQKQKAKIIVNKAIQVMPNNENILLLASKLEREDGQIDKAREYLHSIHDKTNMNMRTYKHLLKFELRFGNIDKAKELAQEALKIYIKEEKMVVTCAHIYNKAQGLEAARKVFRQGLAQNKLSVILWVEFIELEIRNKNFAGARPLLEQARLKIPKCPELLRLAVRMEMDCNNKSGASFVLSRALKELPLDGELWAMKIELEPKATRKKIINEALKSCENDPYIYISQAKIFWKERKFEKVRRWLNLGIKKDIGIADGWAHLYYLEKSEGNQDKAKEIKNKLETLQLKRGRLWNSIRKSEIGWNLNYSDILEIVCEKIETNLKRIE